VYVLLHLRTKVDQSIQWWRYRL